MSWSKFNAVAILLLFAGLVGAAQAPRKIFAQELLDETLAKHRKS